MDPVSLSFHRYALRLPRARGDGPCFNVVTLSCSTAPPRTRGWTHGDPLELDHRHGSPAHAGMDPRRGVGFFETARLPRARGDGPTGGANSGLSTRAPPRTRG